MANPSRLKSRSCLPCDVETDEVPEGPSAVYTDNLKHPFGGLKGSSDLTDSCQFDSGLSLGYQSGGSLFSGDLSNKFTSLDEHKNVTRDIVSSKKESLTTSLQDEGFISEEFARPEQEISPSSSEDSEPIHHLFEQDEDGDSQLHLVVLQEPTLLRHIVKQARHSGDINVCNNRRQTALHLSALVNQPTEVRILKNAGANPELRDCHGNTALHLASQHGFTECARQLLRTTTRSEIDSLQLSYKVSTDMPVQSPDLRNYDGFTCLHLATLGGHKDLVTLLLGPFFNADINAKDGRSGRTVLHHLVEKGDDEMLMWLLESYKDLNLEARTYDNHTAMSLAQGRGRSSTINMLLQHGADDSESDFYESDDEDYEMEGVMEDLGDMRISNCVQ